MQTISLKTSVVFALKLSLCLYGTKFISGVQAFHGLGKYGFPSETISAISVMPSYNSPKRSSYFGGSTTKNSSPSTVVAIPLYIRGSKQSKPPMLFDILSSSLTESSSKNRKLTDAKPKSISSVYEPQQQQQQQQQQQLQTEQKKLDEYANYASAGYASGGEKHEKQTAGVSSQNLKPQSNNKLTTSQKSLLDNSQKTDYYDITPAIDRYGLNKQTDNQPIYDSNTNYSPSTDSELNGEKILHKKRESLIYGYGSNQNIGSFRSFAHDSGYVRPHNTVTQNSAFPSVAEVSSSYVPSLRNIGHSNSGHVNNAYNNADNIYSAASTYYNPASNNAKNSFSSQYVTAKPYSAYTIQDNHNLAPNFNEYNSETNNSEMKDNDNTYDYQSSISHNTKKSNEYVISPSNSENLDSYGKQTASTGYITKSNDGECYDNKAIHSSEYSFSAIPLDDQKAIPLKPTQTSSLTSYESDEIDPSKLDLKIVHLPISVLKRLVASGELGLPSFQ